MLGSAATERKFLEKTYDGIMTAIGSRKETVDGETVITPDVVLAEKQPCALSKNDNAKTKRGDASGEVSAAHKIFCAPELDIPAGCRITVAQYGRETSFLYSGKAFVYSTHQELMVQEVGRA